MGIGNKGELELETKGVFYEGNEKELPQIKGKIFFPHCSSP